MAFTNSSFRLPDSFAASGDPVDGNPFAVEDVRHKVWNEATQRAEEELCRVNVDASSRLAQAPGFTGLPTLVVAKFDVWAKRAVHVVWSDVDLLDYDSWLLGYANACIDTVSHYYATNPPPFSVESVLIDLRNRLGRQVQYWKAEARRDRAQQQASDLKKDELAGVERAADTSVVAGRLETLRRECGWSLEDLAKETHQDKKAVSRHLRKETVPRLRTLKIYADTFSKKLGRAVKVADLEGEKRVK